MILIISWNQHKPCTRTAPKSLVQMSALQGNLGKAQIHHRRGGGVRGGTISWENFGFKEGGEILPLRNSGVSAGAGVHAREPAGQPAQGSPGRVGVVHIPMALEGPA